MRLPIDVCMVFTANPEDYTARGKIITPLKDRIGSEVRTHYPTTLEQGVAITQQEAWTAREDGLRIPRFVREVVEGVAFAARRDKKIDRRSGVSQRLPISALENAISNAERRALATGESPVVPRISDIYAALPSLTGKFELEYEGELMGAENVARELIREAVGETFSVYLGSVNFRAVVAFFEGGGTPQAPRRLAGRRRGGPAQAHPRGVRVLVDGGGESRPTRRRSWPRPESSCSRASGRRRRSAAATTAVSWPPSGGRTWTSTWSGWSGCAR